MARENDATLPRDDAGEAPVQLRRRGFLGAVMGATGAALLPAGCATSAAAPAPRSFPVVKDARALSAREWAVLEALQDRLLPSAPGSPGARDVNAIAFLDGVLTRGEVTPRVDARIRAGVIDVEAAARARAAPSFVALDEAGRDEVLAVIARRYKGRRFLRYVLTHALEAFLGDPVHGGNPDEIAWSYLGHRAGYPRPATNAGSTSEGEAP